VNPSRALARDDALLPPLSRDELTALLLAGRAEQAEACMSEAQSLDAQWQRARYGKVVGPQRGQRQGVNTRASPPQFESREVKIAYLDRLKREAQSAREMAAWYAEPDCTWLPSLDPWRSRYDGHGPEVGDLGEIVPPLTNLPQRFAGSYSTRLPLRVLSTDADGSAVVVAETTTDRERRAVGYFVLRDWPQLATMVTGDRLPSVPGLWRVSGVSTYHSAEGGIYSTLVIERLGDSSDILEHVIAASSPAPGQDATPRDAEGRPETP
jgi:hypothetical protein